MKKLGEEGVARDRVEKDKAMFGGRELKGKTLAVIGLGHIGASTARDASELGSTYTIMSNAIRSCMNMIRKTVPLDLSLIHIPSPRDRQKSRMPSSA